MDVRSPVLNRRFRSVVLANAALLLLVIAVFAIHDYQTLKDNLVSNLLVQAKLSGRACSQPLLQGHPDQAANSLSEIEADPEIRVAGVYSAAGLPFAVYTKANSRPAPSVIPGDLSSEQHWFENSRLVLVTPILVEGRRVGYVYLRSSFEHIYHRLWEYFALGWFLLAIVFFSAMRILLLFNREVNQPAIELAGTMRVVLEQKDYSLRASENRHWGELWALKDRLNELLACVQSELSGRRSRSDEPR